MSIFYWITFCGAKIIKAKEKGLAKYDHTGSEIGRRRNFAAQVCLLSYDLPCSIASCLFMDKKLNFKIKRIFG